MEKSKKIEILEGIVERLKTNDSNIYFLTIDTKGAPSAAVANTYEMVKILTELGYKAHVLYDKPGYASVDTWLDVEYSKLSHKVIEGGDVSLDASDIVIIPEVFPSVMESISKYTCRKVVFAQVYSHIFELLGIGKMWNYDYKFFDVITTTDRQAKFIENHFPQIRTHVIAPSIAEYFKPSAEPKKPIIAIMARKQTDVLNIIKSFYLQYPMYKWLSFKDLRGLPKTEFAKELSSACLSVWVDDISSFGTFPLESIECDTPVLGLIPDMAPEWMLDTSDEENGVKLLDNGLWVDNILDIPKMISEFMNLWLTDKVPSVVFDEMQKTKGQYTYEKQKEQVSELFKKWNTESIEEFNNAIEKEKNKDE